MSTDDTQKKSTDPRDGFPHIRCIAARIALERGRSAGIDPPSGTLKS